MKKTQSTVSATSSKPALIIKTDVKAGIEYRIGTNHSAKATRAASMKTHVKAGRIGLNHNAKATKAASMKTHVKAGLMSPNHSAMMIKA
jgi:hypothetical protein